MKAKFEARRKAFASSQEEIRKKNVTFVPSYRNKDTLLRVKSMDAKHIDKYLKPKQNYEKRLNYSKKVRRKNNNRLHFGVTKSQNFNQQYLNLKKKLHFGQYLALERNQKAKENFLHRGDFLQHSKKVGQNSLKMKRKIAKSQSLIGKL